MELGKSVLGFLCLTLLRSLLNHLRFNSNTFFFLFQVSGPVLPLKGSILSYMMWFPVFSSAGFIPSFLILPSRKPGHFLTLSVCGSHKTPLCEKIVIESYFAMYCQFELGRSFIIFSFTWILCSTLACFFQVLRTFFPGSIETAFKFSQILFKGPAIHQHAFFWFLSAFETVKPNISSWFKI